MSTSDHQLHVSSLRWMLSGMVAKPLTVDFSAAGPRQTTQSEHAADMLYSVEWQVLEAPGHTLFHHSPATQHFSTACDSIAPHCAPASRS